MSLAQHVTQAEGFDYERPVSPGNAHGPDQERAGLLSAHTLDALSGEVKPSSWRQISYAPVDVAPHERGPREAAYNISNRRRVAQIIFGVVACWLASGIVFGFAALKPILVAEDVYGELCRDGGGNDRGPDSHHLKPCRAQSMRLNLFFILASATGNLTCLVAGASLDRFGRRFCWLLSSALLAVATLLMAMSFSIPAFQAYIGANMTLAFGGTYLFVSSFELANAFPKHSGLIIALISGAFDASAAVFLFYRLAYEESDGRFSPEKFFYGYLIVPFVILVAEFWLMPANDYHTVPELEKKIERAHDPKRDVHDSDNEINNGEELSRIRSVRADRRQAKLDRLEEVAGDAEEREERVKVEESRQEASGAWGVLHGVPIERQLRSPWYILILVLTSIQMVRMNYFIANLRAQYRYMLGSEAAAEEINHFFDAALPIGGVAATPIIGIVLNNFSVATNAGLLTVFIVAIGVFNCLPYLWAGYATVVAFVLFRPFYYSAISDYAAKVFGFATFGRIYGTVVCISGLVNFSQSGLDAVTYGPLHGNPIPVNMAIGGAGAIVGIVLTTFVAVNSRVFVHEKAELEADAERQRLLNQREDGYGTSRHGADS